MEPTPPIDPPDKEEIRARRDERIRLAIDDCVDTGGTIIDLIINTRIPAGALLEIWREMIGQVPELNGKEITIKMILKLRRLNRGIKDGKQ